MPDNKRQDAPDRTSEGLDEPLGAPDPQEEVAEGRDPGWPIPGLAGPSPDGSPASDADAPAPPG